MDQLDDPIFSGYKETGAGVELPHAHEDNYGGRPGMERISGEDLVLPPPIDDPPMDGEPVIIKKSARRVAAPRRTRPANNAPSKLPPVAAAAPPLPVTGVIRTEERSTPVASTPVVSANNMPEQDDTYINVVLAGDFGRFRSKVADVRFCENHIALVYTGRPGDEDMLFEPPYSKRFDLKIESNDGFKSYSVCHLGLTTNLNDRGIVVVVLPLSGDTAEDQEHVAIETDVEAEHSF